MREFIKRILEKESWRLECSEEHTALTHDEGKYIDLREEDVVVLAEMFSNMAAYLKAREAKKRVIGNTLPVQMDDTADPYDLLLSRLYGGDEVKVNADHCSGMWAGPGLASWLEKNTKLAVPKIVKRDNKRIEVRKIGPSYWKIRKIS